MNTENVNAPNERVDQFKDYLDTQGLRLTQERLTILDQVFNTDTHFRPDDLLVWMRQAGYKTSKATIYRTLPLLIKSGILTEVIDANNQTQYEYIGNIEEHAHLICVQCGKITESRVPEIIKQKNDLCKKFNFHPIKFRNEIIGVCSECRG
ncbi:TPA: transcriptional repressor [Candidatus Poribacteria bacterium]|jgi:Fur family ferric uptake transcriptional regulator|nr:transcriptional repressor [Candidatus Poribacteria bacterium]HIB87858.1 transcriptional repressor [Candidatus Poribacteria bacterium]HIC00497.1 transcriptional repressor [Candidatus Poribacteria bacterium]HIN30691.1 transcriptional repressor [Candidatus Poribacteria bacterium]HIO09903.1 transcriptional repressor [Candidatus Poribacteria bacterium]